MSTRRNLPAEQRAQAVLRTTARIWGLRQQERAQIPLRSESALRCATGRPEPAYFLSHSY